MQAAGEAHEEGEYVRLVIVDLLFQDANMWNTNEQIALLPGALVLDSEALWRGGLSKRVKCSRLNRQAVSTRGHGSEEFHFSSPNSSASDWQLDKDHVIDTVT